MSFQHGLALCLEARSDVLGVEGSELGGLGPSLLSHIAERCGKAAECVPCTCARAQVRVGESCWQPGAGICSSEGHGVGAGMERC